MKAPKSLFDRPGRAAAVVGAVVAVSATAAVALVSGTATATPVDAEPGRCTKNVNVRAQPDIASEIIALCEEGMKVQVGESRAGFLRLENLGGWAAQEYISVNGQAPAPADRTEGDNGAEDDGGADSAGNESGEDTTTSGDGEDAGNDGSGADDGSADEGSAEEEQAPRGLGGLLR
jgi:hypothetical protein